MGWPPIRVLEACLPKCLQDKPPGRERWGWLADRDQWTRLYSPTEKWTEVRGKVSRTDDVAPIVATYSRLIHTFSMSFDKLLPENHHTAPSKKMRFIIALASNKRKGLEKIIILWGKRQKSALKVSFSSTTCHPDDIIFKKDISCGNSYFIQVFLFSKGLKIHNLDQTRPKFLFPLT